jgi:hypothetical protein
MTTKNTYKTTISNNTGYDIIVSTSENYLTATTPQHEVYTILSQDKKEVVAEGILECRKFVQNNLHLGFILNQHDSIKCNEWFNKLVEVKISVEAYNIKQLIKLARNILKTNKKGIWGEGLKYFILDNINCILGCYDSPVAELFCAYIGLDTDSLELIIFDEDELNNYLENAHGYEGYDETTLPKLLKIIEEVNN